MVIPIYHTIDVTLTTVSTKEPIADVPCGTCAKCCEELTPFLTVEELQSGLYPISLYAPSQEQLSMNPNLGPTIAMFRNPKTKGCSQLIDGKCSIYDHRPIACKQFDCRKNHHPRIPDMTIVN